MFSRPMMLLRPGVLTANCRVSSLRPVMLLAVAITGLLGGCSKSGADTDPATTTGKAEGRHPVTGVVVSANVERGTILVQHDEIPGVMPAMTMEFKAGAGDVANARPGQRFRAITFQAEDGFHLEQIWPQETTNERIITEAAKALRADTVTRGSAVYREVGENLPEFALYDQDGEVVTASRFRGRYILLNFIFTRCPDPNMCPAATAKMMGLQRRARDTGVENFELISITLDPEFDTPGVLREFADARGLDTSNFSLLTGPEGAIKDLLSQLGVLAFQNGPLITHTLTTVLIDPTGRIAHRVDGTQWNPDDFLTRLPRKAGEAEATASGT